MEGLLPGEQPRVHDYSHCHEVGKLAAQLSRMTIEQQRTSPEANAIKAQIEAFFLEPLESAS